MVVHAIGMDPNVDNPTLSEIFGVDLEVNGFVDVANRYGAMGETSRPGVFVAGAATGPETIDDSIAQGHGTAMAVLSSLKEFSKTA
jgi:heterodisulfide reductase subunit A